MIPATSWNYSTNNGTLLILDINTFKHYNDTYGHWEGDILLQRVADIFRENLRSVDSACRYGGDEFAILLPKTGLRQAEFVANKIIHELRGLNLREPVALSIGIAQCKAGDAKDDLIRRADAAMYEAKAQGKNYIVAKENSQSV